MSSQKEYFISAVKLIKIDGEKSIPSVVAYKGRDVLLGSDALDDMASCDSVEENFKIDLGKYSKEKLSRKDSTSGGLSRRSTLGIAQDFCHSAIDKINFEIERHGLQRPTKVLIAEPLSLEKSDTISESWLSNYRSSLRSILHGKFEEIDFMPEPFAVFQYYRYGLKHPLITEKKKHTALVLDFGGGTFDVSIIETTSEGDISRSGRNSKPLAASSIAVGGNYINQVIADELLFCTVDKKADKTAIRKAIRKFGEVRNNGQTDISDFNKELRVFFRNYAELLRNVESAKIAISSNIANWDLDTDLKNSSSFRVSVPQKPFAENPKCTEVRFDAEHLHSIFSQQIWRPKLYPAIKSGLNRAAQELDGKPISILLLSGGSSNIRWLRFLIERDLHKELIDTDIIELSDDYQEIVAKGLAVECARRFYTKGEGDFRAVTYNRLCLALNPNNSGIQVKRYRPSCKDLSHVSYDEGVLLPSASSLRGLIGKSMRWKVKLSNPPTSTLDYFFLRSSFDPQDIENLHNIVDNCVYTPKGTKFDKYIEVELIVREDGTAMPRFIYGRSGDQGGRVFVEGRPFYMDMTFATEEIVGSTYLGFDFGTSTTAFSYVKNDDIKTFNKRSKNSSWKNLSDLIPILPYPISYPLASFISETNEFGIEKWGRETVEAMLTLTAYIAYIEACSITAENKSSLFKGFMNRSAGPLWKLLKESCNRFQGKEHFSRILTRLLEDQVAQEISTAVDDIAQAKHGKKAANLDYQRTIAFLGNMIAPFFDKFHFGYFDDIRLIPFSDNKCEGVFRSLNGPSPPFVNLLEYKGAKNIPKEHLFIVDPLNGIAMNLSPLILGGLKSFGRTKTPEIHFYDKFRHSQNDFCYKSVQEDEEFVVSENDNYKIIYNHLSKMKSGDLDVKLLNNIVLVQK